MILSAYKKNDPSQITKLLKSTELLSEMFKTNPFPIPDESVDGLIRFALTEKNKPVGLNPHECHFLICGQTGTGKSTLLKLLFSQAILFNKSQGL